MSECVVRMEMPKSCEECPLVQTDENDWGDVMSRTCNLIYKGYLSDVPKGERRADCPIICALPDGHGRLVDADAMADDVRSLWDYKTVDGITASTVLKQIMTDIGNCPTIVPADTAERSET